MEEMLWQNISVIASQRCNLPWGSAFTAAPWKPAYQPNASMSSVPDLHMHRPRLTFSLNSNLLGSITVFCFFSFSSWIKRYSKLSDTEKMLDGVHPLDLTGLLAKMCMLCRDTLGCIFFSLAFRAPEEAFGPTMPCLVPPHHEVQLSPAVSRSLTFTPIMKWMAYLFMGMQDFLQTTRKTHWQHKCTVSLRCWSAISCHIEKKKMFFRLIWFPFFSKQTYWLVLGVPCLRPMVTLRSGTSSYRKWINEWMNVY